MHGFCQTELLSRARGRVTTCWITAAPSSVSRRVVDAGACLFLGVVRKAFRKLGIECADIGELLTRVKHLMGEFSETPNKGSSFCCVVRAAVRVEDTEWTRETEKGGHAWHFIVV